MSDKRKRTGKGKPAGTRERRMTKIKTELSTVEEHDIILRKAIEQRAYALYEFDAYKDGNDQEHWFQAEYELIAQNLSLALEDDAVTVRIATERFSPNAFFMSISALSILIFAVTDDSTNEIEATNRDLLQFISLPVEVDPAQITCAIDGADLTLKLPVLTAASLAQSA
jgi:hypothetical protein